MGFEYLICFSENMRKKSSNRSQIAVIKCSDYAELDRINQEKEKFIPAYTGVRREQERKKLSKKLAAAKEKKNEKLCKMLEDDLGKIEKKSFKTNIGRFLKILINARKFSRRQKVWDYNQKNQLPMSRG